MTKAEEIERYKQIVASLPQDSYLRGLLAGTENFVADCIINDFAHPSLTLGFWRERIEREEQLSTLLQQIKAREDELTQLNSSVAAAQRLRDKIRADAHVLGQRLQAI